MKYSGIDLHSNNCVVTVTDDSDKVVAEKRVANDLEKIIEFLKPWQGELAGVVVESTYNWYWFINGLQEAGFDVKLANTGAIRKYDGLKHTGDEADARHLAHLLRLGILPTGTILPPAHRALRDLARKRLQLVRSRTSHILAVENILARQKGARINSNQIKRLTLEDVTAMGLPADVCLAIQSNLAVIMALNAQVELLERRLQESIGDRPEYALLTSVPGSGAFLPASSCSRPGRSIALPRSATTPPTPVASTANASATARRRGKATPGTATSTSPGPLLKPPTLRCVSVPKRSVSTNANERRQTTRWQPRRWPTSWRGPASTS